MDISVIIGKIVMILLVVGGINWGLYGLLGLDLVAKIFGGGTVVAKLVYTLVGVSGVLLLLRMLGVL